MTDIELENWARAHVSGVMLSSVAVAVLRVLAELDAARVAMVNFRGGVKSDGS